MRKAFYLGDIHDWIRDPQGYRREDDEQSTGNLHDTDGYKSFE